MRTTVKVSLDQFCDTRSLKGAKATCFVEYSGERYKFVSLRDRLSFCPKEASFSCDRFSWTLVKRDKEIVDENNIAIVEAPDWKSSFLRKRLRFNSGLHVRLPWFTGVGSLSFSRKNGTGKMSLGALPTIKFDLIDELCEELILKDVFYLGWILSMYGRGG